MPITPAPLRKFVARRAAILVAFAVCGIVGPATFAAAQPYPIDDVSPASDLVDTAAQGVDAHGNAMFMWSVPGATSGQGPTFRTARYESSTSTFSAPSDLVANPGTDHYSLRLVVDPAGDATAYGIRRFLAGAMPRWDIVAARYTTTAGQWGDFTTLLSAVPAATASMPVAVVDATGHVTIVWSQATCEACTTYTLYAARYSAGGGWTTRAIAENVWFDFSPSAAVDAAGNVVAIAARLNASSRPTILAARFESSSGSWVVTPGPATETFIDFTRLSAVAMTGDGRAVVMWQESFGPAAARFDSATGTWGPWKSVSSSGEAPTIAADHSGNFVLMYVRTSSDSAPQLRSRRYSWATDIWEDQLTVSPFANSAGRVVTGDDGVVTGLWFEGSPGILKAARYNARDNTWASAIDITSISSGDTFVLGYPHVDATGTLRISWIVRSVSSARAVLRTTRWLSGTGSPGTPRDLRASVNGNIVTFNWSAPPTGTAPTGYTLLARVAAGSPVIATIPIGAGRTFTAAAPNGTYVVSVAATDMNGMGPESAAVTITVPQVSLPPGAPANLAASASGTTANFTWNAPTTGGAVNNYLLVAGLTPAFGVPYTTVPLGAATSFSVAGVPAGIYYVRVHAQNAGGTSPTSNEVPLTVAGPMLPSAPSLNTPVVSGSSVTLSWTAGAGGGAPSSYTLVASVTPGGTPIVTVPLTGVSASFTGVPSGTYFLRLIASNAVGSSPPSAEIVLVVS